jgi:N-acetylglucosamine kinase-like BadF-type ATPase
VGYLLGLDQGSSKTVALIADRDGKLLAVAYGGGACHAFCGLDNAICIAKETVMEALRQADAAPSQVEALVAGMTGADWPEEAPMLSGALRQATGIRDIRVVNDCLIAMRAGTDQPFGAVLCGGTGLNAAVRSPGGREFVFGYYVDQEDQGGTALGLRTVKAVLAAEAGLVAHTALTMAVLGHLRLPSVDQLLRDYVNNRLPPAAIPTLAPVLLQTAAVGDLVAGEIVACFSRSIARYVVAGLKRFDMLAMETEVVLSGGIFKSAALAGAVAAVLSASAPLAVVKNAPLEPVVGAILMALDQADGTAGLDSPTKQRLLQSSAGLGLLRDVEAVTDEDYHDATGDSRTTGGM